MGRGALALVLFSGLAATGHAMQLCFVAGSAVWLLALRRPPHPLWLLAIAVLARAPWLFSNYFSSDLYRYVWEGRIQWEGFSPYLLAPDADVLAHLRRETHHLLNHPELTTIYPPLAQMFFAGLAGLGLEEAGFRNVILLLDVAVVLLLLKSAWGVVYAWSPVAVAGAAVGHMEPLMLLFLAGSLATFERRRFVLAAALLGGAILAKTVAVLLVPWLMLRQPKATLLGLAPVVVLGYLPYLGGDLVGTLYTFGADFAFNGSLAQLAPRWVLALLLMAWVGAVSLSQPRPAHAFVLVFAGLLLLSPTVHVWYMTWFLVALPMVGPRRWTLPLVVWCVSVAFSSQTYHAHYFAGEPFAERFALTVLEYALPAACALWLVWRSWPRRAPPVAPQGAPPASAGAAALGAFAVVVPCRGEVDNLRDLLPRFQDAAVIVADTPTGDGTRELAAGLPHVRYLAVHERGYGAAVKAGLEAARESGVEFAVVCDADHDLGPRQVRALLAPFRDPRVGLVTGARGGGGQTLPQRLGNELVTLLIALGWGRWFRDLGPFRALRLQRWPEGALNDQGSGWNVEMNVRALELGMAVVEVDLPPGRRVHGRNRISGTVRGVVQAGYGILRQLYRLREESCRQPSSS